MTKTEKSEREEDRKRIEESKEGGAIKQGIGRATVGFSGDRNDQCESIFLAETELVKLAGKWAFLELSISSDSSE